MGLQSRMQLNNKKRTIIFVAKFFAISLELCKKAFLTY